MTERIDPQEALRIIDEANRQSALKSEYAGNLGSVIKNGAEKLGVSPRVITMCRRLFNLPPAKRDAELIDMLRYMHSLQFFSGESLIEDGGVRDHFIDIAEEVAATPPVQTRDQKQASEDLDVVLH